MNINSNYSKDHDVMLKKILYDATPKEKRTIIDKVKNFINNVRFTFINEEKIKILSQDLNYKFYMLKKINYSNSSAAKLIKTGISINDINRAVFEKDQDDSGHTQRNHYLVPPQSSLPPTDKREELKLKHKEKKEAETNAKLATEKEREANLQIVPVTKKGKLKLPDEKTNLNSEKYEEETIETKDLESVFDNLGQIGKAAEKEREAGLQLVPVTEKGKFKLPNKKEEDVGVKLGTELSTEEKARSTKSTEFNQEARSKFVKRPKVDVDPNVIESRNKKIKERNARLNAAKEKMAIKLSEEQKKVEQSSQSTTETTDKEKRKKKKKQIIEKKRKIRIKN